MRPNLLLQIYNLKIHFQIHLPAIIKKQKNKVKILTFVPKQFFENFVTNNNKCLLPCFNIMESILFFITIVHHKYNDEGLCLICKLMKYPQGLEFNNN